MRRGRGKTLSDGEPSRTIGVPMPLSLIARTDEHVAGIMPKVDRAEWIRNLICAELDAEPPDKQGSLAK